MRKIVQKTAKISKKYLKDYGFNKQQVDNMLELSINDMDKILNIIEILSKANKLKIKDIKKQLHALKGLVAQLHNLKLAKKIEKIEVKINRKNLEKLLIE